MRHPRFAADPFLNPAVSLRQACGQEIAFEIQGVARIAVPEIHAVHEEDPVSDVPALVNFFVGRFAKRMEKPTPLVPSNTMRKLTGYDWPGNVRELQNVIERAVILSVGDTLTLDTDFGDGEGLMEEAVSSAKSEPVTSLKDAERAHIESVLQQTNWLIEGPRGAAKMLGVHPNTLRSRIQKFALRQPA